MDEIGNGKGYVLTLQEILEKMEFAVGEGANQMFLQGGVYPDLSFDYYLGILSGVKNKFPSMHIRAFPPVEIINLETIRELDFILKMKLITRSNNLSGLKVLLAAEYLSIPIELEVAPSVEKTVLIVNEDCQLFSSNAAVWYLFCKSGHKKINSPQDKWMDWESAILQPEIQALTNKQPHQLTIVLEHLDKATRNKFLIGVSCYLDLQKLFITISSDFRIPCLQLM
jgi:hypothetical protein